MRRAVWLQHPIGFREKRQVERKGGKREAEITDLILMTRKTFPRNEDGKPVL